MGLQISLILAFSAGLLSFLSACLLPLLPVYIAFFTGGEKARLFQNIISFVAGFVLVFVLLGATATGIGRLLTLYAKELSVLSALLLLAFGFHLIGIWKSRLFMRSWTLAPRADKSNLWGAFLFGVAFSLGWAPCTGPVLTGILILAGSKSSVWQGAVLLFAYAMGLAIPFILSAWLWRTAVDALKILKRYSWLSEKLTGLVMMAFGAWILVREVLS